MHIIMSKAMKRRVGFRCRSESPGLVERGTEKDAEHGLGAGVSMRLSRVCPLQLLRQHLLRTKVVPRRFFVALVFDKGDVFVLLEV